MHFQKVFLLFLLTVSVAACDKYTDPAKPDDPRLDRPYCNDPTAVNYNWDFPGYPDSTVCFYPSSVFSGNYLFRDSIYLPDGKFDSLRSLTTYSLRVTALTRQKFSVIGFCSGDSIRFTADRFYRSTGDTSVPRGQLFCRATDTLSGTIIRNQADTEGRIYFTFTVVSDTATNTHRGTAYRQ